MSYKDYDVKGGVKPLYDYDAENKSYKFKTEPSCNHNRETICIGNHEMLVTSYMGASSIFKTPIPDLGVYLAAFSWAKIFEPPKSFGAVKGFKKWKSPYPAIVIEWTDGQGADFDLLDWLVNGILENLEQDRLVEVGCFGGHGRTGTLLACVLGAAEKLPAREAILELRHRYCYKAVESATQADTVADYLNCPLKSVEDLVPKIKYTTYYPKGNGKDKSYYGNFGNLPAEVINRVVGGIV